MSILLIFILVLHPTPCFLHQLLNFTLSYPNIILMLVYFFSSVIIGYSPDSPDLPCLSQLLCWRAFHCLALPYLDVTTVT